MTSSKRVLMPRDLATRFSPSTLVGHFLLAHGALHPPVGWHCFEYGAWTLLAQDSLPVLHIVDGTGAFMGWMLGHPISESTLLEETVQLQLASQTPSALQVFEQYLEQLAGRFLAIVFASGTAHVYPDSTGSLAALYSPEHQMLSSSPFLVPYTPETQDRVELLSALRVDATRGQLLFGLGPRRGLWRLLPNHVLDISSWT